MSKNLICWLGIIGMAICMVSGALGLAEPGKRTLAIISLVSGIFYIVVMLRHVLSSK